jgi:hypothetical protein
MRRGGQECPYSRRLGANYVDAELLTRQAATLPKVIEITVFARGLALFFGVIERT